MKFISFFSIVFTFFVMVAACNNDSNDKLTPKETLTSHGWKISSKVEFGNAVPGYDYSVIEDCEKDDCWIFYEDGSYKKTTGSIKCDPDETDSLGTWSLSDAGSGTIDGSSFYSFVTIDETSLVLQWEYSGWGFIYTYIPC